MSEFAVPVFHVTENYKFVGCQTLLQEEQRLHLTKVVSNVRRVCCGWDDGLRSIIASNSEERRGMQQKSNDGEREINNMDHNMDRLLVLHGELRFGSLSSQLESRNSLTVHLPSGKIKIPPRK
jgi:hypothetical protein